MNFLIRVINFLVKQGEFATRYSYKCFCDFLAITWIRFIGFRQNLAWTYYLTLGTNLRKNFSFFSKSKMAAGGQKSKIGQIWLIIWIWFIRFGPNLAGRYYSTQGTSLCKNFLPIAKSKMAAAAAITANYEIGHNLKSIQFRNPIFFPRPMFSRVRNAMKLSFAFYDLSNYLKIENGRQNWRFQTYSRGALYFF